MCPVERHPHAGAVHAGWTLHLSVRVPFERKLGEENREKRRHALAALEALPDRLAAPAGADALAQLCERRGREDVARVLDGWAVER